MVTPIKDTSVTAGKKNAEPVHGPKAGDEVQSGEARVPAECPPHLVDKGSCRPNPLFGGGPSAMAAPLKEMPDDAKFSEYYRRVMKRDILPILNEWKKVDGMLTATLGDTSKDASAKKNALDEVLRGRFVQNLNETYIVISHDDFLEFDEKKVIIDHLNPVLDWSGKLMNQSNRLEEKIKEEEWSGRVFSNDRLVEVLNSALLDTPMNGPVEIALRVGSDGKAEILLQIAELPAGKGRKGDRSPPAYVGAIDEAGARLKGYTIKRECEEGFIPREFLQRCSSNRSNILVMELKLEEFLKRSRVPYRLQIIVPRTPPSGLVEEASSAMQRFFGHGPEAVMVKEDRKIGNKGNIRMLHPLIAKPGRTINYEVISKEIFEPPYIIEPSGRREILKVMVKVEDSEKFMRTLLDASVLHNISLGTLLVVGSMREPDASGNVAQKWAQLKGRHPVARDAFTMALSAKDPTTVVPRGHVLFYIGAHVNKERK